MLLQHEVLRSLLPLRDDSTCELKVEHGWSDQTLNETSLQVTSLLLRVLTKMGATGQPLSCSGTPEGIRRLCRCFSFLFSTFFFPLRFCLLFVFFLGVSCNEELQGSWTEAVVGHATLLCSVERLKQKYNVDLNTRRDIKQSTTTTTTGGVTCGRSLVEAMPYLLVKQLGEGTKDWKEDGLNTWESWDSPEENKCWC